MAALATGSNLRETARRAPRRAHMVLGGRPFTAKGEDLAGVRGPVTGAADGRHLAPMRSPTGHSLWRSQSAPPKWASLRWDQTRDGGSRGRPLRIRAAAMPRSAMDPLIIDIELQHAPHDQRIQSADTGTHSQSRGRKSRTARPSELRPPAQIHTPAPSRHGLTAESATVPPTARPPHSMA